MKAYVELGEVTLMEEASTNLWDRLLVRLLVSPGCWVSEALTLKVEHITKLNIAAWGINLSSDHCGKCRLYRQEVS